MQYWVFGVTRITKFYVIWRKRRSISTTYIPYGFCSFFLWNKYRALCRGKKKWQDVVLATSQYFFKVFLKILGGTLNQNPSARRLPRSCLHLGSHFHIYVGVILLPKGLTHNLQATRIIKTKHSDVFQQFLTLHDPFSVTARVKQLLDRALHTFHLKGNTLKE